MKSIQLLVAAFLTGSVAMAQQAPTLQLKTGESFVVTSVMDNKTVTNIQGQDMESSINSTTTYQLEVKDDQTNKYTLSNTLTHMKMSVSQMGQEMAFDSDKEEDLSGPLGAAFADYINKPQKVQIDYNGNILKDDKAEEKTPDASAMGLKQLENSGFGTQFAFEPLPKNLKVGDTWDRTSEEEGITRKTHYSVKSINGDLATISLNGTMSSEIKMTNQGMDITTKTDGQISGEEIVNVKSGIIESSTSNVKSAGTVNAAGQEFPVDTEMSVKTSIKKI